MKLACMTALLLLSACTTKPYNSRQDCTCPSSQKPAITNAENNFPAVIESNFAALPGWANSDHKQLTQAFIKQCNSPERLALFRKKSKSALIEFCLRTTQIFNKNPALSHKIWLENELSVWQLQQSSGETVGLLTGYYEPELNGSRHRSEKYKFPLFSEPSDLITVKLDSIDPELKGKRLRGRLEGQSLVPYFDRTTWQRIGPERQQPIVWIDNPLEAFLIQVQGSGRIRLENGEIIRLSYANQNGHPYSSIGKTLVNWGELTAKQATIPGIQQWLEKNPSRTDELFNTNPSVVFFSENRLIQPEHGPVGALGIPLTSTVSIAIDQNKIPYGSLMWLESSHPASNLPLTQGALAQDTGGAIRGRVRADYFWGTGKQAGELAGITRQPLKLWVLWPKEDRPPPIQD